MRRRWRYATSREQACHRRHADAAGVAAQIAADERIESVCGDDVYDTRGCLGTIAERQAIAAITPRKNASHWKKSSAGSAHRNEAIRACKRSDRSIGKKWSG